MEIGTPTPIPNVHGTEAIVSPSGRTWKRDDRGRWHLLVGSQWHELPEPKPESAARTWSEVQSSWNAWAGFCQRYALTPGSNRYYRPLAQ